MDQAVEEEACAGKRLIRVVSDARGGIVFVDANGQLVGMDSTAQRRLDGEVKQLKLPLRCDDARSVDCFVSAETVHIGGEPVEICVIQEREAPERAAMTAIESVLNDTSSFAREIIERIKTLPFASSGSAYPELELLTEREKEVLGLIYQGKSDLEMSAILNVSNNTVRNHISSLYRKIGVNRRSAAILWVRERGISSKSLRGRRSRY